MSQMGQNGGDSAAYTFLKVQSLLLVLSLSLSISLSVNGTSRPGQLKGRAPLTKFINKTPQISIKIPTTFEKEHALQP